MELLVIGGGAAGMMAALAAAEQGVKVTLLERNQKVGRKLYITGKGRCNVTNHCPPEEVLRNTLRNGKFLYSAVNRFPPQEVEAFFEGLGVPLKVERGNRVYPASDKAANIIDGLFQALRRKKVPVLHGRAVSLTPAEGGEGLAVETEEGQLYTCKAVILATGGCSYPLTGSTGDGYEIARQAGHTVTPLRPSLVPLESPDPCCGQMQGLSLRNVGLQIKTKTDKVVYQDMGELLFTHFGLSGPIILSASAHLTDYQGAGYRACLDLKPALDRQKLDARLVRDFAERANQNYSNALGGLAPQSMVPVLAARTGIPGDTKVHDLRREQRRTLLDALKNFEIPISGPRPIEEAIVTSGGVKVGEVDPRTMASKKCPGLFLAGELLDVDAYTGGFNLQIAWSTGRAAGLGAAAWLRD